ncbi:discoidin domain-containing protein [Nocardia iowensis]|nr:discoidin domain-containing protein [Nocardia iowensis]
MATHRGLFLTIFIGGLVIALTAVAIVFVMHRPSGHAGATACPDDAEAGRPGWTFSGTDPDAAYDQHPFVGNGYLGLRVPPHGAGYLATGEPSGWPLYTPRYDGAFVAGLFGRSAGLADDREVTAAIPNWSGLTVRVGNETYSPATPSVQLANFAQTVHLRCGLVRTTLTWTTPNGRTTDLVYEVLTDRSDQHVGAVRLTVVPRWSGEIVLTDVLDGAGARRLVHADSGDRGDGAVGVDFRTEGTEIAGTVASIFATPSPVAQQVSSAHDLSVSSEVRLEVQADSSYEVTKYVGVDTALTAADPTTAALDAARRAADRGWSSLLADTSAAWRMLWHGDIELPQQTELQTWARGSLYSLYSATNSQQDNSISPAGLSSDNYAGAVFWDADVWMFPALVQLAPQLAKSIVEYRYKTLPAARSNAQRLGLRGAFYPWTSTSRGELAECHSWDPPHCLTQIHLQGDVSLAAWQYYVATGDAVHLRSRVWPIMQSVAEFWASRVTQNPDSTYSIANVAGPDEYSNGVTDAVYTNAVAALALRNAARAAAVLGERPPAEWTTIADRLRIPFDPQRNIFLQYDGYPGTPIKQADTVLLIYPLEWPMSREVAANVLEFYAERTDPDGPAMTDSVHAIDAAAIGTPGCATGTYLQRSVRPFIRGPFWQFAEARGEKAGAKDPLAGAPAFTFATAAGGFLQTFTNGLLGLRLRDDHIRIDPTLPPTLKAGLTIRGIQWQGRTFDAQIGPDRTQITVTKGPSMRFETSTGTHSAGPDQPSFTVSTRRADLEPSDNIARCALVSASSEEPGRYADAAVDGSLGTSWAPNGVQGSVTVDLGVDARIGRIVPQWTDDTPPSLTVLASSDEQNWTMITLDSAGAPTDPISARYLRLDVTGSDPAAHPGVRELEVFRR